MTALEPEPVTAAADPGELDRNRWTALYRWAAARTADRTDWDAVALLGVMHGCRNAGVAYEDAETVLWRVARTGDDPRDFAELKDLARSVRRKPESVPANEAFRVSLAALKARNTGPQPALTAADDPEAGAGPAAQ